MDMGSRLGGDTPSSDEPPAEITEAEFISKVGRPPTHDEMRRVNCRQAGDRDHEECGWCAEHDLPRFHCGCYLPDTAEKVIEMLFDAFSTGECAEIGADLLLNAAIIQMSRRGDEAKSCKVRDLPVPTPSEYYFDFAHHQLMSHIWFLAYHLEKHCEEKRTADSWMAGILAGFIAFYMPNLGVAVGAPDGGTVIGVPVIDGADRGLKWLREIMSCVSERVGKKSGYGFGGKLALEFDIRGEMQNDQEGA